MQKSIQLQRGFASDLLTKDSAPDAHYRLALCTHHVAPTNSGPGYASADKSQFLRRKEIQTSSSAMAERPCDACSSTVIL